MQKIISKKKKKKKTQRPVFPFAKKTSKNICFQKIFAHRIDIKKFL